MVYSLGSYDWHRFTFVLLLAVDLSCIAQTPLHKPHTPHQICRVTFDPLFSSCTIIIYLFLFSLYNIMRLYHNRHIPQRKLWSERVKKETCVISDPIRKYVHFKILVAPISSQCEYCPTFIFNIDFKYFQKCLVWWWNQVNNKKKMW